MVEETIEDIEESLDWFLRIWGDLPLISLMITGLVPVEWFISVLLKVFTEGKEVCWLLDWIVELKEVGKLNLFAVSPIGAPIQDGGKRKRSAEEFLFYYYITYTDIFIIIYFINGFFMDNICWSLFISVSFNYCILLFPYVCLVSISCSSRGFLIVFSRTIYVFLIVNRYI